MLMQWPLADAYRDEVYNLLNSSAVLTYNTLISRGTWLQPLTVLTPRFFKITAEIEL